jgi:uncharacterized protein YndB with AHSA1/START domain
MTVERKSARELIITRRFDDPARLVFAAWTIPDLLKKWWVPKSMGMTLVACAVDARTGGTYRFEFGCPGEPSGTMVFFGKYLEATPDSRLVWTNEESTDGAVTTVTFAEKDGQTLLTLREVYPSKEALDEAFVGMESAMPEQFWQLDELLVTLDASATI